ncbi:MAG: SDR family oxidoreductase [Hyphomicrobiaceae bacterium]|nr:SDR family oxidoreductase [Hyphomicrobiaceae bacterium]
MFMSVSEIISYQYNYSELAGNRVLITGISPVCGLDIAMAFAKHNCSLVLQVPNPCPETDAILQMVAEITPNISAYHDPITNSERAIRFAQKAVQTYGGIETVINFIPIDYNNLKASLTIEQIETFLHDSMQIANQVTRVTANRMGLTWFHGSILNIMRLPKPKSKAEIALAGVARAALASMTVLEASNWAEQGVRINAVAPQNNLTSSTLNSDDCLYTKSDLVKIAVYLASANSRGLSGYVFSYQDSDIEYTL